MSARARIFIRFTSSQVKTPDFPHRVMAAGHACDAHESDVLMATKCVHCCHISKIDLSGADFVAALKYFELVDIFSCIESNANFQIMCISSRSLYLAVHFEASKNARRRYRNASHAFVAKHELLVLECE